MHPLRHTAFKVAQNICIHIRYSTLHHHAVHIATTGSTICACSSPHGRHCSDEIACNVAVMQWQYPQDILQCCHDVVTPCCTIYALCTSICTCYCTPNGICRMPLLVLFWLEWCQCCYAAIHPLPILHHWLHEVLIECPCIQAGTGNPRLLESHLHACSVTVKEEEHLAPDIQASWSSRRYALSLYDQLGHAGRACLALCCTASSMYTACRSPGIFAWI